MRLFPYQSSRRSTTVTVDARRMCMAGLALVAVSAPPAFALSVFDIIQLSKKAYGDQAIIDLIEATDSAFDLEAQDLPKLKQLGVSEPVIRSMLERAVREESDFAEADFEAIPVEIGEAREHEPSPSPEADLATPIRDSAHRASNPQLDGPITTHPVLEARAGDHYHLALALDGLEIMVLRDEGGFESVATRGRAIAARLGEAWAAGRGQFRAERTASGARLAFRPRADGESQQILVLSVSAADARAYALRSGRNVTPDLLAMYWADLFSDFWSVAYGDPPERLMRLHEGEALGILLEALVRLEGSESTLRAAADLVPSSVRHHLQRLAQAVPMDYGPDGAR